MRLNRVLYLGIIALLAGSAYVFGERLLYVALAVMAVMPPASYIITFIMLRTMRITQNTPYTLVKNEPGIITIMMYHVPPSFLSNISCVFYTDNFAVEITTGVTTPWAKINSAKHEASFTLKYRGVFQIGLESVQVTDLMGLFHLKRKTKRKATVTSLPRVVELENFPMATHLLTQAHSRFDIKDEDYATISDIRPYLPTDSIKRVHWKLTAKRSEWLVKNFQSNALNKVTMLMDTTQRSRRYREQIVIEDRIVELAMGLARFCLRRGMPIAFFTGEGHNAECFNAAAFETVYHLGSRITFSESPLFTSLSMLTHCLNEAAGYMNMLIFTTQLDGELYERIINGKNNGHYISVLYFPTVIRDPDSINIFQLLSASNVPVFRIDENSIAEESAAGNASGETSRDVSGKGQGFGLKGSIPIGNGG